MRCEARGTDKRAHAGRLLRTGRDVNAEMVRQGLAWAFVKYSTSYVKEEADARAPQGRHLAGRGTPALGIPASALGNGRGTRQTAAPSRATSPRNGRIYHMPWSPWYAQIRMEPDKGKRWFCTEAEAVAAGWRPVQTHSASRRGADPSSQC